MGKRIGYIDGLRGLACVGVFIYHFILYVFPATYTGNVDDVVVSNAEVYLSNSPISIFVNGNFYVCLFFVISALVLSLQVFRAQSKRDIAIISVKRYPRLAFPVIIIGVISFIIGKALLLFGYDAGIPAQNLSILGLIKILVVDTWLIGSSQVLSVFWMLSILFYGSFITIIIAAVISCSKKSMPVLFVCTAFIYFINIYYMSFTFGIFIAYILAYKEEYINEIRLSKSVKKYLALLSLLVIGIILGGYPTCLLYPNSTNLEEFKLGLYAIFEWLPGSIFYSSHFFHIIGAVCILFAVMISESMQKVLTTRIFQFFGKISFALYIIHKLILYIAFPIISKFGTDSTYYALWSLIMFIISAVVVIISSWLFNEYVEKYCNKLTNKIVDLLMR